MQKRNRLFAIILAIFMMAIVAPMAFAADEVVTIDLANGNVIITETGYSIDGGAETAFTGDYIFTGKNDETKMANVIQINSLAEGTDITFKDVEIAQKGPSCLYSNVDLAIKATGSVKMSNMAPIIGTNGQKFEITGDADISVTSTGAYFAAITNGTIDIACKSLELTGKSSSSIINQCADFKVNAAEDVALNGWISSNNIDVVAGGDIFVGNANSTAPILQGTISLKSTNGDITIDHKGMICTGGPVTLEAAGDVTLNADTSSSAIASGTLTIAGDNVTLTNASGAITSGGVIDIDAKGNIVFEGSTSGAPLVSVGTTSLNADGNVSLNNAGRGMLASNGTFNIAAKGDITLIAEYSSPLMYADITATSENGTVTMTNKGSFFITAGDLIVDAKDIVLTVVGAGPITPYGYDLTADNNITVVTGNATTTYDPAAPTAYDFGNKLTVTTSEGTTEHTHEYADVAYNNDATCEADGTKLVKCDCDWAKEKTVTAEGTKLDHNIVIDEAVAATCSKTGLTAGEHCADCDYAVAQETVPVVSHIDEDGDGKCDYDCGTLISSGGSGGPGEAEPEGKDCVCGKEHKTFIDIILCFLDTIAELIKEKIDSIF